MTARGEARDWEAVAAALAPIECQLGSLKRRSRDYYWFSPVLAEALAGTSADLIAKPVSEAQLIDLARYCYANDIPLTPRGAGTGNYGQAMPLEGGIVVDMTGLDTLEMLRPGVIRAGAGATLLAIEERARASGWQLRLYPSTWRVATIGGFISGGSSGCGALNWGTVHSPGNILALRVMTMEAEPRLIELRGAEAQKAIHAYGLTGIVTEVELALAPAVEWHERVIGVPGGFIAAARLGDALCRTTGLHLNEVAVIAEAAGSYFRALQPVLAAGENLIVVLVAGYSADALDRFVAEQGATIRFARGWGEEGGRVPPLLEYCWNHTTLQSITRDRGITYLQSQFGGDDPLALLGRIVDRFGDEVPMHLEFARADGDIAIFGLPLVRYSTADRLAQIMAIFRDEGAMIFNPHTYMLETGGMQVADPAQFAFKLESDPKGLLNPGKMPGWPPAAPRSAAA